MARKFPSGVARYGVAFAFVAAAFAVHFSFRSILGDHLVFLAFLPAALLSAWFGGLGPGLAALMAGFAAGDFFFLPPRFDLVPRGAPEFASLMIYFFIGLFGIAIIDRFHRVRERLAISESHKRTLEREVRERQRVEDALRSSEQELRAAQEALRQHARELERHVAERTTRLRESLGALENVLYHVAHDLRAPVRAMHSFTELLLENYGMKLDSAGEGYARRIEQACRRMDRLTSDLLAYGRLGYQRISWGPVDLAQLFGGLLKELEPDRKARGAEVQLSKPMGVVLADFDILEQVSMNLLSNALKFVPPGASPRVEIWSETFDDKVVVNIRDQGIGIEPEYQERIFGVFERLHVNEAYAGTGIGLAIVKRGVERMGGHVGVESSVGHGSRFWLELKRASPAQ